MDSLALVIFGITSNLAQKYSIPALYDMEDKGLLPDNVSVFGVARAPKTREEFMDYLDEVLHMENRHHKHEIKPEVAKRLFEKFHYLDGNLDDPDFYERLRAALEKKDVKNRIFYLATFPELYHYAFENLQKVGLNKSKDGWVRIMVEKPFGEDLRSAHALNELLLKYFTEDQIYRLDHYLGKDTLQNILAFRFGNGLFEPLINKEYIDHIQISATEDFGVGKRGRFYDNVGALKDVGQNHLLQMLTLATMDAPADMSNESITQERSKILKNLIPHPHKLVFGQYEGYLQEEHISEGSTTETFYALKTEIDNDRFRGVPIYIRAGKKLKSSVTEIAIVFKVPANRLMNKMEGQEFPNVLIYRIQPNEGIVLKILTKKPGHKLQLDESYMQFCYRNINEIPDPYERLLADVIRGDQTFFNDATEVEAEWAFVDPLLEKKPQVHKYEPGSWGPKAAEELIKEDGREWLEPSMDFCAI